MCIVERIRDRNKSMRNTLCFYDAMPLCAHVVLHLAVVAEGSSSGIHVFGVPCIDQTQVFTANHLMKKIRVVGSGREEVCERSVWYKAYFRRQERR